MYLVCANSHFLPLPPQFVPGDVWIIGDSIVRRAATRLGCTPPVFWNGLGGARYGDITKLLSDLKVQRPRPPAMLIVHVGTNELVVTDFFSIRQRIAIFMHECREAYPEAKLVWSDILPRACYFGTTDPSKIEMKRRKANKWARSYGRRIGVSVLNHPQFAWSNFALFRYDGVHLSSTGNTLFQANLCDHIRAAFG